MSETIKRYFKIGDNLKNRRILLDMNQTKFAEMLGLPRSTYSNYENNNRVPDENTLEMISTKLGISLEDLIGKPLFEMTMSYDVNKQYSMQKQDEALITLGRNPILLDIFYAYKKIFKHYDLFKLYGKSYIDFFYSDNALPQNIVSSITSLILGELQQTHNKIKHGVNSPIKFRIEAVYDNANLIQAADQPIKLMKVSLGDEESDARYLKYNILSDLEKLSTLSDNKPYMVKLDKNQILNLIETVKQI
ncbi:MAG: helix-turn-helix transcriptional regulator [Clostridiaceae bacterium]